LKTLGSEVLGSALGSVQMCCTYSRNADIETASSLHGSKALGSEVPGSVLGSVQVCCTYNRNADIETASSLHGSKALGSKVLGSVLGSVQVCCIGSRKADIKQPVVSTVRKRLVRRCLAQCRCAAPIEEKLI
jgi:hypothetical protein